MTSARYYIAKFRFQQLDGFVLWVEKPEVKFLWSNEKRQVPVFRNPEDAAQLGQRLGFNLEITVSRLVDLDVVAKWLDKPEKMPPQDSLAAWNMFADLGAEIEKSFIGNAKGLVRNRVFDLLYASFGPWSNSIIAVWPRQELNMLRRVVRQGFCLWDKHVCWVDAL